MKKITRIKIPEEFKSHLNVKDIAGSDAYPIHKFSELVEAIAKLSYENEEHLLFYRGQSNDYVDNSGKSTFLPTIYRGQNLSQEEIDDRFDILENASKELSKEFLKSKTKGYQEVRRKTLIRWSILQHYEVCPTPLIDITQSLRVACSFAFQESENNEAFIYVFGFPYLTNRISINSELDLINVRLLSICPPDAFRPYFQEGYLVGTSDVTNEILNPKELDLSNRLIAKFKIPKKNFWDRKYSSLPKNALYPEKDKIMDICSKLNLGKSSGLLTKTFGEFMVEWMEIESIVRANTYKERKKYAKPINTYSGLRLLNERQVIDQLTFSELDKLRILRNDLVHNKIEIKQNQLKKYLNRLKTIIKELRNKGL
nr:FRG domain-containing protein [uncultured Psychroserpens sp.]